MATFEAESYLTITVRRVHRIEADDADAAQTAFDEGERGELISEETVKIVGDEELTGLTEMVEG